MTPGVEPGADDQGGAAASTTLLRTVEDVQLLIADAADASRARLLVGIVGAPAAGKSTLAANLVRRLNYTVDQPAAALSPLPRAALLPMDGFHLPQAELRRLGRRDRMGAPDTFDVDGLVAILHELRAPGARVHAPGFDREVEEAVPGAITIGPEASIVVVEGNYLVLGDEPAPDQRWGRVAPLLDLTLFLEVPTSIRQHRLIARHEQFGKSAADARTWALGPDESNAHLIATTAERADHLIRLG